MLQPLHYACSLDPKASIYFKGAKTIRKTTLSIMTLGITTLNITALRIVQLNILPFSIMTLGFRTLSINYIMTFSIALRAMTLSIATLRLNHRHQSNIDCLMAHTACLVCFSSNVNGCSKKSKMPWKMWR